MSQMYIEEIKTLLPQRFPFLMIDRVTELDLETKDIRCYKNVSGNEDFFNGHFPNQPVMPGVMIVEAMAQACGILGFSMSGVTVEDGCVYLFGGADKIRFRQPVVPGDRLEFHARYIADRRNMWKFTCDAHVDGKLVSSAEITCVKKDI